MTTHRKLWDKYQQTSCCAVVLQREAGGELSHFLDPLVIKVACSVFAIGGVSLAVWYRLQHPMPVASARRAKPRTETPQDAALGNRISALMAREELYTNPEIKVADLARALGEPDYRVSQAITGALGFQNFNRLINHHRIERAKDMLADLARIAFFSAISSSFGEAFASSSNRRSFSSLISLEVGRPRAKRRP